MKQHESLQHRSVFRGKRLGHIAAHRMPHDKTTFNALLIEHAFQHIGQKLHRMHLATHLGNTHSRNIDRKDTVMHREFLHKIAPNLQRFQITVQQYDGRTAFQRVADPQRRPGRHDKFFHFTSAFYIRMAACGQPFAYNVTGTCQRSSGSSSSSSRSSSHSSSSSSSSYPSSSSSSSNSSSANSSSSK